VTQASPHPPAQALASRFNASASGRADGASLVFIHGFGCNQTMWRHVAPAFASTHRIILLDLMGCGLSDASHWSAQRYASLEAYARDVLAVVASLGCDERTVLVGHSVGAAVALLAESLAPSQVAATVLIAPSPCFANNGAYRGGFQSDDLQDVLRFIDDDRDGWAREFAALIVGRSDGMAQEFVASFCAGDPAAMRHLARLTFLIDQRALLKRSRRPALILQCSDDVLAPVEVGRYMQAQMPRAQMKIIFNRGHSPHLTASRDCISEIKRFLARERTGGPAAAPSSCRPCRRHS
jgi:sigma-B regulation protein RsbQ